MAGTRSSRPTPLAEACRLECSETRVEATSTTAWILQRTGDATLAAHFRTPGTSSMLIQMGRHPKALDPGRWGTMLRPLTRLLGKRPTDEHQKDIKVQNDQTART